jgi:alpha-L-fucosidase
MRYAVLTSKHHDGFCLWDSPSEPYNAVRWAAARRDIVRELSLACKQEGIRFCTYYSLLDWHHPDFTADYPRYVEHAHRQIEELLTRYEISGLWFDGDWTNSFDQWRSGEILAMIRRHRPLCTVNDRLGRGARGIIEGVDYYSKEQEIPGEALRRANRPAAWETCQTFGYSWGYCQDPDPLKSGERIIEQLVDVVSKGGNFLLNVGPRPDGTIPEAFVERMKVIGQWMARNGESIYGTSRSPFGGPLPAGRVAAKGNRLYVFLQELPPGGRIELPGLRHMIQRALLLDGGEPLAVLTDGPVPAVAAPAKLRPGPITVVVIELEAPQGAP